jgi:uncharacterized protein (TIGR00369 family)
MGELGAEMTAVRAGEVEITVPFADRLTQQHGFLHAAVVAAVLDSACGYAALTLMPADAAVVTAEYKINLLAPADGDVRAVGEVIRAGSRLTVCRGDAYVERTGGRRHVATMIATMIALTDTSLTD